MPAAVASASADWMPAGSAGLTTIAFDLGADQVADVLELAGGVGVAVRDVELGDLAGSERLRLDRADHLLTPAIALHRVRHADRIVLRVGGCREQGGADRRQCPFSSSSSSSSPCSKFFRAWSSERAVRRTPGFCEAKFYSPVAIAVQTPPASWLSTDASMKRIPSRPSSTDGTRPASEESDHFPSPARRNQRGGVAVEIGEALDIAFGMLGRHARDRAALAADGRPAARQ